MSGRDPRYAGQGPSPRLVKRLKDAIKWPLSPDRQITFEQLNELLLLIEELRVSSAFYRFFILGHTPDRGTNEVESGPERSEKAGMDTGFKGVFASLKDIKKGTTRFRGFAMLAFGNFRFAFRQLSKENQIQRLCDQLRPWAEPTTELETNLQSRPDPIAPIAERETKIPPDETWHLGYLTVAGLLSDLALAEVIRASRDGLSLGSLTARLENEGKATLIQPVTDHWPADKAVVEKLANSIDDLLEDGWKLQAAVQENTDKGIQNTQRYLTWDFMDVYIATSMRYPWEFKETHDFVDRVFNHGDLNPLKLRWFDPTQSYEAGVIDKGLVEALMLKRARCTLYMVQESDTLGKDSELAATLAQGKPVVAYIRKISGPAALNAFAAELDKKPIAFSRRRLHMLFSEGFFRDSNALESVLENLDQLDVDMDGTDKLVKSARSALRELEDIDERRVFQVIGDEESGLRQEVLKNRLDTFRLMAALEAVAMDKRAGMISRSHPLSMQVNLDSGVGNGVFVTRSESECAQLLRGLVTNDASFRIEALYSSSSKEQRLGTVLVEKQTASRFRYVTYNEHLTNSFWNFYLLEDQLEGRQPRNAQA